MPLTEEQKQRLRAKMGQPSVNQPSPVGGLPPQIRNIVSTIPQGQPYPTRVGPSGIQLQVPPPQAEVARQLAVQSAKQQVKSLNPPVSDAIKREFSRIDTFEGLFTDLQQVAKNVRKGRVKGNYVKAASKLTGGDAFLDIGKQESNDALTYSELRVPVAAGFYRAITGDDRISDRDAAQRALPLVPDLSLSPEAFERRLRFVQRAVERKRRSIQKAIRMGGAPPSLQDDQDSTQLFQSSVLNALMDEVDNTED